MKTISQAIKILEKIPLSFDDIRSALPKKVRDITVMRELDHLPENCKDSDIFGEAQNCCLFCNRYSNGKVIASHWVVILRKGTTRGGRATVEWCDSLGNSLIHLVHKLGNVKSDGLMFWKKNRKGKILESKAIFQKASFQDCGDHAICRCVFRNLSNTQYRHFLTNGPLPPDMLVTLLTFVHLKDKVFGKPEK